MTKPISINLMVDKSSNRVVYAESDGRFVEVVLTFLTLPLASILRLTNNHPLGSINKLSKGVENLNSDCFRSEACKSMLLRPLNPAAKLLSNLPIDYDNWSKLFPSCYLCNDRSCSYDRMSFYANASCRCGKLMDREVQLVSDAKSSNDEACIFLQDSLEYIISDDLHAFQSSAEVMFELFSKLNIKQGSSLESMRVDVTVEKILELLERLLISDTPLTDVFLGRQNVEDKLQNIKKACLQNFNTMVESTVSISTSVKLFLNKDGNKMLFIESNKEFVDLLVSFLTYPIGSVVNKLGGKSGIRCFDNLCKSIEALKLANCFKENSQIEELLKPMLPPHFNLKRTLINPDKQPQEYYICSTDGCNSDGICSSYWLTCKTCGKRQKKQLTYADPKYYSSDGSVGYMRSSRYVITDDLVVNKLSSVMIITDFLKEAGKGINVRNIEIGEQEALFLLQASITSNNMITDALLNLGEEGGKRRRVKSS